MNRLRLFGFSLLAISIAVAVTALLGTALWDVSAVRALQGNGALRLPMEAATTLGAQGFLLPLVLLIFWCLDRPLGVDLALLLMITGTANITVKAFLQGARPFWIDPALRLTTARSFSTPSGHAANSTALFGYLAWWFAGRPATKGRARGSLLPVGLMLPVIVLVCVSRVYLGVHYPGDVIWGCAEGIIVLAAFITLKPRTAVWLSNRSLKAHFALAAGVAALVLALNLLFLASPAERAVRFGETYTAARAEALSEAANVTGLICGAWAGLALERRYVRFTTAGSTARRALRYLLGLLGLLAIGGGLSLLLWGAPPTLDAGLGIVRSAASALWAVVAWPWLWVRVGLGGTESRAGLDGPTG